MSKSYFVGLYPIAKALYNHFRGYKFFFTICLRANGFCILSILLFFNKNLNRHLQHVSGAFHKAIRFRGSDVLAQIGSCNSHFYCFVWLQQRQYCRRRRCRRRRRFFKDPQVHLWKNFAFLPSWALLSPSLSPPSLSLSFALFATVLSSA